MLSDKDKTNYVNSIASAQTNRLNTAKAPAAPPAPKADNSTQPKAAQGGYTIGGTYAGGLIYLGGDPNDETSWKKAGE